MSNGRTSGFAGGTNGKLRGKTKAPGGAKQKQQQQQQQQQRKPRPVWQRLLPLLISGPLLQGLSSSIAFFRVHGSRDNDRVLFAMLCFLGGTVLVEAFRSASTTFGGRVLHPWADAAVSHFRGNASRYVASFVIVVVLQGVWDEAQEESSGDDARVSPPRSAAAAALPCLAVLVLGVLSHLIAPHLGGVLLRQLEEDATAASSSRLVKRGGGHRCSRWDWKLTKECLSTSVMFGLCITAAVLSGGGTLLLGLGMTHSVVSASREAIPVIRKGWLRRKMSSGKGAAAAAATAAPGQDHYSLQGLIALVMSGPTRIVCSPVVLPTFLLWTTHGTVCSWPKGCTDGLAFLLRVSATAICAAHLLQQQRPQPEPAAPAASSAARGSTAANAAGGSGGGGPTTIPWPTGLFLCACSMGAWALLLLCSVTVLGGRRESAEGVLVVTLAVTLVALRTPRERTWRGLMLLFWVALLTVLVAAACSKLRRHRQVFHRMFSDDGGGSVVPSYLGVLRAMAHLREEGRVAMWTVCASSSAAATAAESPAAAAAAASGWPWFGNG